MTLTRFAYATALAVAPPRDPRTRIGPRLDNPNVLLLDEPTAGVDEPGEERLNDLVHRLQDEQRLTILLISHELTIVSRYATNGLCLSRQQTWFGPPKKILTQNLLQEMYGTPAALHLHDHGNGTALGRRSRRRAVARGAARHRCCPRAPYSPAVGCRRDAVCRRVAGLGARRQNPHVHRDDRRRGLFGRISRWRHADVRRGSDRRTFGHAGALAWPETVFALAGSTAVIVFVVTCRNSLIVALVSPDIARTAGIDIRRLDLLYLQMVALTVALGLRYLGVLLMGSLIIIPAATAKRLSKNLMLAIASGVAITVTVVGSYAAVLLRREAALPLREHRQIGRPLIQCRRRRPVSL